MVVRVAALICSNNEDGLCWVESSSSFSVPSNLLRWSSLRENRVQRIPTKARRKTTPAAMATEIKITTPVAKNSTGGLHVKYHSQNTADESYSLRWLKLKDLKEWNKEDTEPDVPLAEVEKCKG